MSIFHPSRCPLSAGSVRASWAALAVSLAAVVSPFPAQADTIPPAPAFAQVPGVYRQVIGDLQVTALFDGVAFLPASNLKAIAAATTDAWLNAAYVPRSAKGIQTAVNAYLVRTGGQLVLVDAGTASCFGPSLGQVLSNLKAAEVRPEDVHDVLLTHAHPDHMCGLLTADGKMAYPNATIWLSADDAAYWLSTDSRDQAPQALRGLFDMARHAAAPYQAAGRFKTFQAGDALPAGVEALPSPGHTPGHTSWLFHGGPDATLLVWGDIVHYHAVQFRRPQAAFEYDSNRQRAVASRKRLLAQVADEGWWVAGAHLPFPGIGHVRHEAGGYRWVPAEFGPTSAP
ncbi:MBL fold metallo-hydrolase [Ottowia sp.]|uniref:MBL fold metallo-hydrolase n=1 Tax=Ottowia sp. TaxID=1898956 RepID=UPI002618CA47|nr:MBL fold metallo-hydrolase [Ottowia sp.]